MRTSLAFGLTVCVLGPWGDGCIRQHADFVSFRVLEPWGDGCVRHADFVSFRADSLCVGAMG